MTHAPFRRSFPPVCQLVDQLLRRRCGYHSDTSRDPASCAGGLCSSFCAEPQVTASRAHAFPLLGVQGFRGDIFRASCPRCGALPRCLRVMDRAEIRLPVTPCYLDFCPHSFLVEERPAERSLPHVSAFQFASRLFSSLVFYVALSD